MESGSTINADVRVLAELTPPVLEETQLTQNPSQHEVRRTSDQKFAWIDTPRPTAVIHRPKWIIIVAILAAAGVATGFVAGTAADLASPVSNSALGGAISSTAARHSAVHATNFPEANRAAKGNRLRVPVNLVGAAEQATEDWDSRYVQSRAPHEDERKPVAHCEPVGSSLAGPAILYMPPRRCFA
jgi:hypothetical protein